MAVTDSPLARRERDGQGVFGDRDRASATPALGLGGTEPVEGTFLDEVPLHLRSHGSHHEQHLVGDRLPVGAVQPGADAGENL
jgi:hypothetical protein